MTHPSSGDDNGRVPHADRPTSAPAANTPTTPPNPPAPPTPPAHVRFCLASTSPARLGLLRAAGIEPILRSPDVDEDAAVAAHEASHGPLPPSDFVQFLARTKAEAVLPDLAQERFTGLVCGGDSAFLLDGVRHGKPHHPAVARTRWHEQRGRTGHLWSGHWLIAVQDGVAVAAAGRPAVAAVTFADVTDAEVEAYLATGEPLEVAGAFTLDGRAAPFITKIAGDPAAVIGLSLATVRDLAAELGVAWPDLWGTRHRTS